MDRFYPPTAPREAGRTIGAARLADGASDRWSSLHFWRTRFFSLGRAEVVRSSVRDNSPRRRSIDRRAKTRHVVHRASFVRGAPLAVRRMRWLGLGRKAGLAPYVAVVVGVVSGHYLFAEPLREHFAKTRPPPGA